MAENANEMTQLTDENWEQLEELASKLEVAWKKGGPVDLASLLPEPTAPLRKHALIELIKVDLECRWRKGQPVVLDYYLDKYVELGRPRDLPAKLIFEEYRVRHLWGDKPPLTLYQNRFPGQFEQLQSFLVAEPLPTIVENIGTVGKGFPRGTKNISKTENEGNQETGKGGIDHTRKDTTQQIGGYRMLERLGAGAFGEVWKVELPGGILKAVKIIFRPLDHEEAKRELDALQLIKGLRHHFLLQTITFEPTEDRLRILMDLADGSLRDVLKQAKKEGKTGLPLQDIAKWLHQAAEALDYLHEKKMQHRDIKPENILLSEGNVRVADFGLARQQKTQRLASGSGAGTPLYMPPEAWNDKQHANSDQYSLAATYAECRLGRRIYDSEGLSSLMNAHLHDRPKLDPLPADEQKVLLKALAKNPDHRYPTCTAFADDLLRAVAKHMPPGAFKGITPVDPDQTVAGRKAKQKQKQVQTTIMVVGFFALLVTGAIIASLFAPRPNVVVEPKNLVTLPTAGAAGPFKPVKDTEIVTVGDRKLYKQIECQIRSDPELVVRFNLIPGSDKGKQPFYLMENKVSNEVFGVFAEAIPSAVIGSQWQKGGRSAGKTGPVDLVVTDDRARWPVLRVDIQEAHRCAEWLGGVLPSVEQWDKAAGRSEANRGEGPYESPFAPGEIAVGREAEGPLPVGSATKDFCKYSGCRDMAGNGYEWTRTLLPTIGSEFFSEYLGDASKLNENNDPKTALRGRSYAHPEPLSYRYLDETPLNTRFFQSKRTPGYDEFTGFRVALLP